MTNSHFCVNGQYVVAMTIDLANGLHLRVIHNDKAWTFRCKLSFIPIDYFRYSLDDSDALLHLAIQHSMTIEKYIDALITAFKDVNNLIIESNINGSVTVKFVKQLSNGRVCIM
jgi:hypothetical protein